MGKNLNRKVSRAGTYVVRAGETRPAKVVGRITGKITQPTQSDKRAAEALVKLKRADAP
jgi:hypothetical protein